MSIVRAKHFIDITGQTINKLKFIKCLHTKKQGYILWEVECHCGKIFESRASHIKNGNRVSCGCALLTKHERNPNYKGGRKNKGSLAWANGIIRGLNRHAKDNNLPCINLTGAELAILYNSHNHCCDICGNQQEDKPKSFCVDHCHITGEFRGFLCRRCNIALGYFEDSLEGIDKVTKYLQKSKTR